MNWIGQASLAPRFPAPGRPLTIGLLNNTSDRALKSAERHFRALLRSACPGAEFRLELFTAPEIVRASHPEGETGEPYRSVGDLLASRLDGLIVTGMEPQARVLRHEPVWTTLTRVADWAERHAIPVIWSCLAAHAVVLHLDGIDRRPLPRKLSGVFDSEVVEQDGVYTAGLPARWAVPHSRYYGLPEAALVGAGYRVLSRSDEAGVDMFEKSRGAPFLFFQGHPEYAAETLLLEYKRDFRRYLAGERDHCPAPPLHVLPAEIEAALHRMRARSERDGRGAVSLEAISALIGRGPFGSPWQDDAARLCANWLTYAAAADLPLASLSDGADPRQ